MAHNFVARLAFDFIDTECIGHIEPARFDAAQRFQVGATTERLANVVHVGAHIKAFATNNAEIDLG